MSEESWRKVRDGKYPALLGCLTLTNGLSSVSEYLLIEASVGYAKYSEFSSWSYVEIGNGTALFTSENPRNPIKTQLTPDGKCEYSMAGTTWVHKFYPVWSEDETTD